jgi:hypothetical protein
LKNVDYVYILLLTIIAVLLLMLVMKPDPQPVKPRIYSEVVCDTHGENGGLLMAVGTLNSKSRKYLKGKAKLEAVIAKKLKDGWVMLPHNILGGSVTCYAR